MPDCPSTCGSSVRGDMSTKIQEEIHEKLVIRPKYLKEDALRLVSKLRPQWKPEDVEIKEFTDGITNQLVGCCSKNDRKDVILIRVYGNNTELFIDRQKEIRNMKLMNRHGLSPPVFCVFSNGLAYGFSEGKVIDQNMVRDPKISKYIAIMLTRMHSISILNELETSLGKPEPCCFKMIRRYLDLINDNIMDAPDARLSSYLKNASLIEDLTQEVDWLESHLQNCGSPLVFCHNDLLLKNIVYNEEKSSVCFIDFEYADINYQAFDIANHFCEFAGVTDFQPDLYPSEEFQIEWLRNYLTAWDHITCSSKSAGDSNTNGCDKDLFEERVKKLQQQVSKFSLASHLLWGIWALLQTRHSSIDFDFRGFAMARLGEYYKNKDHILPSNHTLTNSSSL